MATAIALFTRDLRVRDNPVLAAAARAEFTLPLFVLDEAIAEIGFAGRQRDAFLLQCLADLDTSLRAMNAGLVIRHGDVIAETVRLARQVGAAQVHIARDASAYARRRERRLAEALAGEGRALVVHDAVHTVVATGSLVPANRDHYAVFTPYLRRWEAAEWRAVARRPRALRLPRVHLRRVSAPKATPWQGGEEHGRKRMTAWLRRGIADYADGHNVLAADGTSRLSPYLHFGCVSALELATRACERGGAGAGEYVRQLAWRDFFAQVLAARPDAARSDYRERARRWRDDAEGLQAWQAGMTGHPVVDAGMRQLAGEGWMHNRARMITASFLTKTLGLDWRDGADHFAAHLVDGDVANNYLNWQWVAGTGNDTRPNRVLNPLRQAERYDADGAYVRRWVPELADLPGPAIHRPWRLPERRRGALHYPAPITAPERG